MSPISLVFLQIVLFHWLLAVKIVGAVSELSSICLHQSSQKLALLLLIEIAELLMIL